MKRWIAGLAAVGALFSCSDAPAAILFDHFDNGTLDPAWDVSLSNATGWTYSESGTTLTVTDISSTVIDSGSGGEWAKVLLARSIDPLGDFGLEFAFSWDCEGSTHAVQNLFVELLDAGSNRVARAGYYDPWGPSLGAKSAGIGATHTHTGPNSLDYSGDALVEIVRVGDSITALWDGMALLTETAGAPITQVRISFEYYAYDDGVSDASFFGTESVDYINVVPEPSSLILWSLLGFAAVAAVGLRRRRAA